MLRIGRVFPLQTNQQTQWKSPSSPSSSAPAPCPRHWMAFASASCRCYWSPGISCQSAARVQHSLTCVTSTAESPFAKTALSETRLLLTAAERECEAERKSRDQKKLSGLGLGRGWCAVVFKVLLTNCNNPRERGRKRLIDTTEGPRGSSLWFIHKVAHFVGLASVGMSSYRGRVGNVLPLLKSVNKMSPHSRDYSTNQQHVRHSSGWAQYRRSDFGGADKEHGQVTEKRSPSDRATTDWPTFQQGVKSKNTPRCVEVKGHVGRKKENLRCSRGSRWSKEMAE